MNFSDAIAALARIDAAQNAMIRAQTVTIEALTARIAALEAAPASTSAEDVAALAARVAALESTATATVGDDVSALIAAADPGTAPAGEGGVTLPDIAQ